jgi:hypothetical protein
MDDTETRVKDGIYFNCCTKGIKYFGQKTS